MVKIEQTCVQLCLFACVSQAVDDSWTTFVQKISSQNIGRSRTPTDVPKQRVAIQANDDPEVPETCQPHLHVQTPYHAVSKAHRPIYSRNTPRMISRHSNFSSSWCTIASCGSTASRRTSASFSASASMLSTAVIFCAGSESGAPVATAWDWRNLQTTCRSDASVTAAQRRSKGKRESTDWRIAAPAR
jgi:hypothetical protein